MTTVRTEDRDGGVRVITLDRPPANAINPDLLNDMNAALEAAREDESVRAIVLTERREVLQRRTRSSPHDEDRGPGGAASR